MKKLRKKFLIFVFFSFTFLSFISLTSSDLGLKNFNAPKLERLTKTCSSGDYIYSIDFKDNEIQCRADANISGCCNPFDQSLNTTDDVKFNSLTVNGSNTFNITTNPAHTFMISNHGNFYHNNVEQDKDILFTVNDGGVSKSIAIDGDVFQFVSTTGTFDFNDDNLRTIGYIKGENIRTEDADTGGSQSCYVGKAAGGSSGNNGNYNTGVGAYVLDAITTGDDNNGFGRASLTSLTTGSGNQGIGRNSLVLLVSGNNNLGIGTNSLYSLISGNRNTGIATESLYNVLLNDNSAFGYRSGKSYNGSFGIFIGSGAGSSYQGINGAFILDIYDANESSFMFGDMINNKLTINGDLNVTGNLAVNGCIKYNCSGAGGCVTLGTCV